MLLAKRADGASMGGQWEAPGGKVDEGENAQQAVLREVMEETGLDIKLQRPLLENTGDCNGRAIWTEMWVAEASDERTISLRPAEHSDAGWFSMSELPSNLTPTAQLAMQMMNPAI